jgi:hypothetical protein
MLVQSALNIVRESEFQALRIQIWNELENIEIADFGRHGFAIRAKSQFIAPRSDTFRIL